MFQITIMQILIAFFGVGVGIVFGALPGMTATMAIAVFLPLTYKYSLDTALYLLLGLYVGGISGGLIPAVLINIPGTPSSICTTFDGYPMARRGEGERALRIGITSSLFGGIVSLLILWFFTPVLSKWAINFGAVEKFLIILFALTIIAALSKGQMIKGVFAGFLGVLVSLVGQFPDNNKLRMVLPMRYFKVNLRGGFELLPVLIGVFAMAQILQEAEAGMKEEKYNVDLNKQTKKFSFKDFNGEWINVIRSALIGTFVGILPGIGGSAASLLSYSQAKNFSKHSELFGTGCKSGIIASETANNGITGGALVPLLSLGIPGDSTTAVLVSAFMLQGVQVGPLFIQNNPGLWKTILVALAICNVFMFLMMFYPIKHIAKIIKLPKNRIYPVIFLMCVVGCYAGKSNMFDVWTMLIFGLVAYLFAKIHLPVAPFFIGFILGDDLEKYFVDSIKGSGGSLSVFFTHPIGWVIWGLIILSIVWAIYDDVHTMRKEREKKETK